MPNYSAKILNNAVRALNVQQAIIANTSNNIANVNTPAYSRRVVNLQTASQRGNSFGLNVGNGVDISGISRIVDTFLDKLVKDTTSSKASSEVQSELLGRVDELFSLTGDRTTIGSALTAFFGSVNDLSADPSSIQLRSVVMDKAQDLVSSIQSTYQSVAAIQTEADQRIVTEIQTVNGLTAQIASLNGQIAGRETSGQVAADERDRREQLLQELAKRISFNSLELQDGSVNVTLEGGFTLVSGSNSRSLDVTKTPSFGTVPFPPSLDGGVLNYIVYDYDSGPGQADIDLTQVLKAGDGTVGGLLSIRGYADVSNTSAFQADGPLVEIASRIEAVTRDLLQNVNLTYLGPDEDAGTAGFQASSVDLNGNVPTFYGDPYGLFNFQFGGARDANANNQPDDLAALGIDNFSSILQLTFTDPRQFAAALDSNPVGGAVTLAPGDGRNALALAALQATGPAGGFSAGSFTFNGSYDELYNETVTHVGGLVSSARSQASLDRDALVTAQNRRDETSAVSLDEEFSGLVKFQKAYQASAKMVKVADDLLTTVIQLL